VTVSTDPFIAPGAVIVGDVRLAPRSSVWFSTIVRGETAMVQIDDSANVQDNCLIESRPDQPVRIGSGVSVGHNARVFGAVVEERSLIAIGATVEPGAVIGSQSIVAANATVPAGMVVPPRKLVIGTGRILRDVTDAEIERIDRGAREYVRLGREYAAATGPTRTQ
jgi:carbonic anhydrase/acetyltransferase-like protein (isoleucine patch superfamily)